jgi:hypothetical protein
MAKAVESERTVAVMQILQNMGVTFCEIGSEPDRAARVDGMEVRAPASRVSRSWFRCFNKI